MLQPCTRHAGILRVYETLRAARYTTSPPQHAMQKAQNTALPHCPGDTHTWPVPSITATRPKLVGLKRCLPRQRMTNLLTIVITAVSTAREMALVRRSKHK